VLISFPDHKSFSPLIECKIFVEMHTFKARLYGIIFENSHLCIKPKKCIRVFWPRRSRGLKTGEDKRHLLADGTLNFLGDRTNYKAKDISGKITNLLIHINHLFNRICYQLANKTTNFLCVIQLFIYIIYDFVSFVASLLDSNRWRH
jgi:hypothetical protein